MGITAITIENFKGIREPVRVELKPITLLFGPNSAGKSTIIQALHYAREIFERENLNPDRTLIGGDTIDLGGFESLVHRHDKSLPIKIRFDINLKGENLPNYEEDLFDETQSEFEDPFNEILTKVRSAWVEVSIEWSNHVNRPLVKRYNVGVNKKELAEIGTSDDGRQVFLSRIEPFNPVFLAESNNKEAINLSIKLVEGAETLSDDEVNRMGIVFWRLFTLFDVKNGVAGLTRPINLVQQSALPRWGKAFLIDAEDWNPDAFDDYENHQSFVNLLSSLIIGPGEFIRNALRKICYLGPLRVIPPRNFIPVSTLDESRWANGMAAWDILFNEEDTFREKVNRWLSDKERFNAGYRVVVKKYKELDVGDPVTIAMMRDSFLDEEATMSRHLMNLPIFRRLLLLEEMNNIEVQPLDIGVGISQVLPVIVAALSAKTGFVAIEQPALHIHPALQVALGDLFIEQVREYPDLKFILETHSEHLMLRFLRRIRETGEGSLAPPAQKLSPEELAIYYTEQSEEGVRFTPIRVNEEGDFIDRWPHGFFDERAEELF